MRLEEIIKKFESQKNQKNIDGMRRYGITFKKVYGLNIPPIRALAKEIGTNHELAQKLWKFGARETKILAALVADPEQVSEKMMEAWVGDFECWDDCDQCCMQLFRKTKFAHKVIGAWVKRDELFFKRAGFVLIASLAMHDKKADAKVFLKYLKYIEQAAQDDRTLVKKAVNWALRHIGKKRGPKLHRAAVVTAQKISKLKSKTAKWIAADALRELSSPAVRKKIKAVQ